MSFLLKFIDRQFISQPPIQTSSFKGKTVIVTGSNAGLGKEASRHIVRLDASKVILACRNVDKGEAAARDIRTMTGCSADILQVWRLDLSSYQSVVSFADRVKAELPRIDALIANAGLGTTTFRVTEGNEESITTNVISSSLLAFLVLPMLHETALRYNTQTHLTYTASELYEVASFNERHASDGQIFPTLNDKRKSNMMDRYSVSKLLGMVFIKQLAAMSPLESGQVVVNCVAPGLCVSELHRENRSFIARSAIKMLARPTEIGARTLVYGASAGPETHGQYCPDCKITPTIGLLKGKEGAELQKRVWSELRMILEDIKQGVTDI